jgi:hypothetical protein
MTTVTVTDKRTGKTETFRLVGSHTSVEPLEGPKPQPVDGCEGCGLKRRAA